MSIKNQQQTAAQTAFTLTMRPDNIALLTVNVPGEKVNTLKEAFAEQMQAVLQQARQHADLSGIIILSGKPDSFIAGADISMIAACSEAAQAETLAKTGQDILKQIAQFPVPVVAAIHGACLGGGLELALACHARVCSLDEKTLLGLPEVQLGLLPGSGGTQRLPQLVGLSKALDMMLTGRHVRARQAQRMGLVDDAVPQAILLQTAIEYTQKRKIERKLPASERWLAAPFIRDVLFSIVRRKTLAKTHGNYPAAERIIDVVRVGVESNGQAGYQAEAKAFGELAMTAQSKALRQLFFASSALKKHPTSKGELRELKRVGVLGGGLMGGGIACVSAIRAKLAVRIKDVNEQGVSHALKYTWQILTQQLKRKRITAAQRAQKMALISGGTDYCGFEQADIVVEAVFEDLALKQQMVAEIEQHCAPYTIFASNTSSLPINQIAAKAARPQQVIGLHYFSPVDKMPLVEVIPHQGTDETTIAMTVTLAQKQGKTAIVVADKAGFYVNRILAPYINEAGRCLLAGEPIEVIDNALVQFGFPVGPLTLLDEVGIDVATKIIPILVKELGPRFAAPEAFDAILNDGRKGRKNSRGFYLYSTKGKRWFSKKAVDESVYSLLKVTPKAQLSPSTIAQRCVMLLLNEAARCLDEGVIRSVQEGDVGAVFGFGFPPFLGGPFCYMDQLGITTIVDTLQQLQLHYGERFTPCERLLQMAQQQQTFYPQQATELSS